MHDRILKIREQLLPLNAAEATAHFKVEGAARLWKSTISLCPECLTHVPALVFSRDRKVWIAKICEQHGHSLAVVENDERYYHLSNKDRWGRRYAEMKELTFPKFSDKAAACGAQNYTDQSPNKACTILMEVTNACNLACAVCYSDAKGDRKLPLPIFKEQIEALIEERRGLDSVQLTGGEAILHPQFWELVGFLHGKPEVKKIYLPTNGIEFAKPATASKLAPFKSKLMVLLQFDGQQQSNRALRNANPIDLRNAVIENLATSGIHMQLTMTITLGVNDHEIGWVVEKGMRHDHVKVIALQPVTYSGRYDLAQDPVKRMTLSDVVKAVVAQVNGAAKEKEFAPIPCSHPNCGWITLYARRFGLRFNISSHIDLDRVMNQVANRTLLNTDELRGAIGSEKPSVAEWIGKKLVRSTDVFAIAIKPFMDKFNYDQDRISACCHHLLNTDGVPISFCEYNARLRPQDSWIRRPLLNAV